MSTATDQNEVTGTLVERLSLKTIVESCLVLEDGHASAKDIAPGCASASICTISAGADIKDRTKMGRWQGEKVIESEHGFMTGRKKSSTVTIASVKSIAFGGGCELSMASDVRAAAESATFGQP